MDILDSKKFRTKAKGELFGGFLFYGEEEYLKRNALSEARKSVFPGGADSFNHIRLDSDNFSIEALNDAIITLPVFAEKKLVEIHGIDLNKYKDKDLEVLCGTLTLLSESPETVLIMYTVPAEFDAGDDRRRSKLFKTMTEVLCPVYFEKQTREKLAKWVAQHFAHNTIACNIDTCYKLMDTTGTDMFGLVSEIEKLSAYVLSQGRSKLTDEDIDLMATKNREIGSFDFANAILSRDTDKAFYILSRQEKTDKSGKEINLTLGSVISIFRILYRISVLAEKNMPDKEIAKELKLNEYRCFLYRKSLKRRTSEDLARILNLISEADLMIKTGMSNGYHVLSRLIVEASR